MKVKETEEGFCIEIKGKDIKAKCKAFFETCCGKEEKEDSKNDCC
jgi:hypothetical protein